MNRDNKMTLTKAIERLAYYKKEAGEEADDIIFLCTDACGKLERIHNIYREVLSDGKQILVGVVLSPRIEKPMLIVDNTRNED